MAKKKILTDNGQEILPITHESCVLDNNGVSIGSKIGNINELATDSRTDLVSAINDILEFNNETKEQLINILSSKGVDCSNNQSFNQILNILNSKEFDLSEIKQISCGHSHMFILKTDGSIWGCGKNEFGQLGLNDSNDRNVFTKVTENINNDVAQVYCGYDSTYMLKNDGTVWACGGNSYGELGLGITENVFVFTQVSIDLPSPVKQISGGHLHAMLLTEDGNLYTCGYALNGRLGLGIDNENSQTTFTQVTGVNNVKQVVCTPISSVILKNDGTIWTCGSNEKGHLGLGDTTNRSTFTQVTSVNNVKQIACGYSHTVVLKNDGTVWACGNNNYGQLGIGIANENNNTNFVQVNNDVKQITCGYSHTFVIKNDDSLWGCGWNDVGQLGLGHKSNVLSFVKIESIINTIKMISCGRKYTAMVLDNGKLYITGDNNSGQLGLGDTKDRMNFMNVFVKQDEINAMQYITANGFDKGSVKQVACSQTHLLILKNDGTVWGCGYNGYGQLGDNTTTSTSVFVKSNIDNVSSIVCGGYNYSIALKNDGTIWGCGYNSGQLGGSGAKYTFTQLDITDVKQVACGYAHTIVLKNDGTLWGTGNADAGQLGIGYQNSGKTVFTQITTNVDNIKEVICGGYCTFIIKNDDTLWVTGQNYGNLGTGDTGQKNNFMQVTTNVNDIKQVAAGSKHTMLLKNDGTLWAVGYDGYGQLGLNNGSTITTFKQVTSNVKQVVCGDSSTIILKNDGSVMGCGSNTKGELGLNHINTQKTFASPQIPNINVKEVFCSNCGQITVLLTDNGEIFTCGINSVGQLGLGVTSDYITIFNKVTFNI